MVHKIPKPRLFRAHYFWKEQMNLHIAGTREKLGEALTRRYEAEGAKMDLEELVGYALDFEKD